MYLDTLTTEQARAVTKTSSSKVFKFGDGPRMESQGTCKLPCVIADKNCYVTVDIVKARVPLLLSKSFMKKAGMVLDMVKDRVTVFGSTIDLLCTDSGHYLLPLGDVDFRVIPQETVFLS